MSPGDMPLRRALTDNALLLAWGMYATSPELEEKLWSGLCVIAVEDIGMGNAQAPVLIETLNGQHRRYDRPTGDRFLFAAHVAVLGDPHQFRLELPGL